MTIVANDPLPVVVPLLSDVLEMMNIVELNSSHFVVDYFAKLTASQQLPSAGWWIGPTENWMSIAAQVAYQVPTGLDAIAIVDVVVVACVEDIQFSALINVVEVGTAGKLMDYVTEVVVVMVVVVFPAPVSLHRHKYLVLHCILK